MMVNGNDRYTEFWTDDDSEPVDRADGWFCNPFYSTWLPPLPPLNTTQVYLDMCVRFDGVASRSSNNVADINATVAINATLRANPGSPTWATGYVWTNTTQQPNIDCRMLREVYIFWPVFAVCVALNFVIYFFWPIPKAPSQASGGPTDTKGPSPLHDAFEAPLSSASVRTTTSVGWIAKKYPRLRIYGRALKASLKDAYMWGSLTYLATATLYLYARYNPDVLASHQLFNDLLWTIAAAIYVYQAVFYHLSWQGMDRNLTFNEVWALHCNTYGCAGFVVSSAMYLWNDDPNVVKATAWFEFVFYVICFFEAFFCVLSWWDDFRGRDGADDRPWYWWPFDALIDVSMYANMLDLLSGILYLMSSVAGLAINKRTLSTIDTPAEIAQWSNHGEFTPPQYVVTTTYNINLWGKIADTSYFVDSFLFLWMAWVELVAAEEEAARGAGELPREGDSSLTAPLLGKDTAELSNFAEAHHGHILADAGASSRDESLVQLLDADASEASVSRDDGEGERDEEEYYYDVHENCVIDHMTFFKAVFCCKYRRFNLWRWPMWQSAIDSDSAVPSTPAS